MTRQGCVHTMFLLRLCSILRCDARHDRTRMWLGDGMHACTLCHSVGLHMLSQACPMHDVYDVNVSARSSPSAGGLSSEKSFDPDSAGFVGDASLSEKSYDPDTAGFLRSEKSSDVDDDDKSFDASEDSFDPDNVPDSSEDGASATSFDPERAAGGAMASERSFDPDQNDGEHDEQDLSGFDDQQPRNVATISAEVAQRAMANLNTAANAELQKLRKQVEELTKGNVLLKGALADAETSKNKLKESFEKIVTEGTQREQDLAAKLSDASSKCQQEEARARAREDELMTAHAAAVAQQQAALDDALAQVKERETAAEELSAALAQAQDAAVAAAATAAKGEAALVAEVEALTQRAAMREQEVQEQKATFERDRLAKDGECARLQRELDAGSQQYQSLLASVNQWVAWRVALTAQVTELKAKQSELLTVIDASIESKLASATAQRDKSVGSGYYPLLVLVALLFFPVPLSAPN